MSESTPSAVDGTAAGTRPPELTDAGIEAILSDFRSWLRQLADQPLPAPAEPAPPIDLHTLLGQFTALRHEVHLQTRATRTQQEQNAETLRRLGEALDALQNDSAAGPADEQAALRPLLKTLVDLYDALGLADRESRRVRETIVPALDRLTQTPPAEPPPSFWSRWFGGKTQPDSNRDMEVQQAIGAIRPLLDSLVTGYAMSLQRIDRALQQHGLTPIDCVGQPFDPEKMEVVEAVAGSGRPPGEVIAEARRGYLWNGAVFRFAQVSVAKSSG